MSTPPPTTNAQHSQSVHQQPPINGSGDHNNTSPDHTINHHHQPCPNHEHRLIMDKLRQIETMLWYWGTADADIAETANAAPTKPNHGRKKPIGEAPPTTVNTNKDQINMNSIIEQVGKSLISMWKLVAKNNIKRHQSMQEKIADPTNQKSCRLSSEDQLVHLLLKLIHRYLCVAPKIDRVVLQFFTKRQLSSENQSRHSNYESDRSAGTRWQELHRTMTNLPVKTVDESGEDAATKMAKSSVLSIERILASPLISCQSRLPTLTHLLNSLFKKVPSQNRPFQNPRNQQQIRKRLKSQWDLQFDGEMHNFLVYEGNVNNQSIQAPQNTRVFPKISEKLIDSLNPTAVSSSPPQSSPLQTVAEVKLCPNYYPFTPSSSQYDCPWVYYNTKQLCPELWIVIEGVFDMVDSYVNSHKISSHSLKQSDCYEAKPSQLLNFLSLLLLSHRFILPSIMTYRSKLNQQRTAVDIIIDLMIKQTSSIQDESRDQQDSTPSTKPHLYYPSINLLCLMIEPHPCLAAPDMTYQLNWCLAAHIIQTMLKTIKYWQGQKAKKGINPTIGISNMQMYDQCMRQFLYLTVSLCQQEAFVRIIQESELKQELIKMWDGLLDNTDNQIVLSRRYKSHEVQVDEMSELQIHRNPSSISPVPDNRQQIHPRPSIQSSLTFLLNIFHQANLKRQYGFIESSLKGIPNFSELIKLYDNHVSFINEITGDEGTLMESEDEELARKDKTNATQGLKANNLSHHSQMELESQSNPTQTSIKQIINLMAKNQQKSKNVLVNHIYHPFSQQLFSSQNSLSTQCYYFDGIQMMGYHFEGDKNSQNQLKNDLLTHQYSKHLEVFIHNCLQGSNQLFKSLWVQSYRLRNSIRTKQTDEVQPSPTGQRPLQNVPVELGRPVPAENVEDIQARQRRLRFQPILSLLGLSSNINIHNSGTNRNNSRQSAFHERIQASIESGEYDAIRALLAFRRTLPEDQRNNGLLHLAQMAGRNLIGNTHEHILGVEDEHFPPVALDRLLEMVETSAENAVKGGQNSNNSSNANGQNLLPSHLNKILNTIQSNLGLNLTNAENSNGFRVERPITQQYQRPLNERYQLRNMDTEYPNIRRNPTNLIEGQQQRYTMVPNNNQPGNMRLAFYRGQRTNTPQITHQQTQRPSSADRGNAATNSINLLPQAAQQPDSRSNEDQSEYTRILDHELFQPINLVTSQTHEAARMETEDHTVEISSHNSPIGQRQPLTVVSPSLTVHVSPITQILPGNNTALLIGNNPMEPSIPQAPPIVPVASEPVHRVILQILGLPQSFLELAGINEAEFDMLPQQLQIEQINYYQSRMGDISQLLRATNNGWASTGRTNQQSGQNNNNNNNNSNGQTENQQNNSESAPDTNNGPSINLNDLDPFSRRQFLLESPAEILALYPIEIQAEAYRVREEELIMEVEDQQRQLKLRQKKSRIAEEQETLSRRKNYRNSLISKLEKRTKTKAQSMGSMIHSWPNTQGHPTDQHSQKMEQESGNTKLADESTCVSHLSVSKILSVLIRYPSIPVVQRAVAGLLQSKRTFLTALNQMIAILRDNLSEHLAQAIRGSHGPICDEAQIQYRREIRPILRSMSAQLKMSVEEAIWNAIIEGVASCSYYLIWQANDDEVGQIPKGVLRLFPEQLILLALTRFPAHPFNKYLVPYLLSFMKEISSNIWSHFWKAAKSNSQLAGLFYDFRVISSQQQAIATFEVDLADQIYYSPQLLELIINQGLQTKLKFKERVIIGQLEAIEVKRAERMAKHPPRAPGDHVIGEGAEQSDAMEGEEGNGEGDGQDGSDWEAPPPNFMAQMMAHAPEKSQPLFQQAKNIFSLLSQMSAEDLKRFNVELAPFKKLLNQLALAWATNSNQDILISPQRLIIDSLPHLFSFETKKELFKRHLRTLRQRYGGRNINLNIKRNRIFNDSYEALAALPPRQLLGAVRINFVGEDAYDAGGVTREWYLLLSREIFNPNYALFELSSSGNTYQPNPRSAVNHDHLRYFYFAGLFLGKALFNEQLVEAFFTRSFYKQILGQALSFKDLEDQDLDFYNSMLWLTQNPIDPDTHTMSYLTQNFGKIVEEQLVPNGKSIPVNEHNKHQFIELYCLAKMSKAIQPQLKAFMKGFQAIIPKRSISFFEAKELEILISGLPSINLADLKANTNYGGYQAGQPTIKWFWQILEGFSQSQLAKLIQFVTGTSRIPSEGFSGLRNLNGGNLFTIVKTCDLKRLPVSHTCFNQLDLPPYKTKEQLQEKLRVVIEWGSEGFGIR